MSAILLLALLAGCGQPPVATEAIRPDPTEAEAPGPVRYACTGAEPMGGRLQPPRIAYRATEVVVVFVAIPLQGGMFTCPGNPSASVAFDLQEPLGDRELLDGAFFPPAEPIEPAS